MPAEGQRPLVTIRPRYRLDDVRRFAAGLAAGLGLAPTRASSLATHLLWFDAAGASKLGIASLPELLDRIEARAIDPRSEPAIVVERGSTAVVDGRRGVPLLVLERAGGIATEKARDTGLGLVRVRNLDEPGSAMGIAAEMALGPVAALIAGPGPRWSVALPAPEGLPAVFDTRMAGPEAALWLSVLAPEEGWLVAALAIKAMEPLSTFHERVAAMLPGLDHGAGALNPAHWEAHRREVREHGVSLDPAAWDSLTRRAEGLGIEPPTPIA